MTLIAVTLFATLSLVALLHIGWAFGMAWPASSRAALPAMVVGTPAGGPMPPALLTIAVALATFGLGLSALWGAGVIFAGIADNYRTWLMLMIAAVFLIRALATYLPFGPLQASVMPFRRLDLRFYAPLCAALGAGYLALAFAGQ